MTVLSPDHRALTSGLAALGFAAVALAGPAAAADLPRKSAPPPSAVLFKPTWDGFYAGSFVGGGFADFSSRFGGARASKSVSGATGGTLIGWNWSNGSFVYGVEGDIGFNLIRGTLPAFGGQPATGVDTLYSAHLRGRLGYDLGDFLPFVAAGATFNESYQRNAGLTPIGGGLVRFGDTKTNVGWTVGAGLDYRVGTLFPWFGPFVLRAEYLYEDVGDSRFNLPAGSVRTSQGTHYGRVALVWQPSEGNHNRYRFSAAEPGARDWTGHYGGLFGGGSFESVETRFGGVRNSLDASGGVGGVFVGTNYQWGRIVVGFDGDVGVGDVEGRGAQPGSAFTTYRSNIRAHTRGRLGYSYGDFLPFLAGGLSWSRSEQRNLALGSENGRVPVESYTVGGGLEYRVSDRVSLRGEYLYDASYNNKRPGITPLASTQSFDGHTVRAGVAYYLP